ncbi:MAG: ABC transporter ATP-binding protein [Acidimicrobiia bacterium]|nr:ABC transporter ATP-binding protein [Acidimicrobiia bacterium]
MTPVLAVENLRKTYGSLVAVQDISFQVGKGEIFGILGPNGAGKTTTVECIQGLRHHDAGRVSILGRDPRTQVREIRRLIGSQLQDSALPGRIKVREAIDLFGSLSSSGPSREALLEDWGLTTKRTARFANLSGGQQQRLFVALALVNDPQLVFLDEMTTGLDPASRRLAWDLIRRIRERGTTVVLVTHFMDEAENLCDRLVVIDEGSVKAEGSPQQLIDAHGGGTRVRFSADGADVSWLSETPGVREVVGDRGRYEVRGDGPLLAHVAASLVSHGIAPMDLRVERATLEDVFLSLTDRSEAES